MLRNFVKTARTPRIIAEIGINHNGQIDMALEMVRQAKDAGAAVVKFQKRSVDIVYSDILNDPRDDGNPYGWETQGEQKHGLELSDDEYRRIDHYCKALDIPWFASAWDMPSLEFLSGFQLPYQKIASAMVTHLDFVEAVARIEPVPEKIFMSTGGCNLNQISLALDILNAHNHISDIILMHCVGLYPCPNDRCNLNRLLELAMITKINGADLGYSGHETGILPSIMAMSWGAEWIERHITLDRSAYGSDQAASLEIQGLKRLVDYSRLIQPIAGDLGFNPLDDEIAVIDRLRYWVGGGRNYQ